MGPYNFADNPLLLTTAALSAGHETHYCSLTDQLKHLFYYLSQNFSRPRLYCRTTNGNSWFYFIFTVALRSFMCILNLFITSVQISLRKLLEYLPQPLVDSLLQPTPISSAKVHTTTAIVKHPCSTDAEICRAKTMWLWLFFWSTGESGNPLRNVRTM